MVTGPTQEPAADALTPSEDRSTLRYFDSHVIEYMEQALDEAAAMINAHVGPGASLVDIGCGVGNTLEHLVRETGIERVAGIDISPKCLEETERRVGCPTFLGSVLDQAFLDSIEERYDVAVLAAVLHHLIGSTRAQSKRHAQTAIGNAISLLKPGGYLVIHEPVYGPPLVTGAVFWAKKAVTAMTPKRVELGNSWMNIGPPVVSYMTTERLGRMVAATPGAELIDVVVEPVRPPLPMRLVLRHAATTILVRRAG